MQFRAVLASVQCRYASVQKKYLMNIAMHWYSAVLCSAVQIHWYSVQCCAHCTVHSAHCAVHIAYCAVHWLQCAADKLILWGVLCTVCIADTLTLCAVLCSGCSADKDELWQGAKMPDGSWKITRKNHNDDGKWKLSSGLCYFYTFLDIFFGKIKTEMTMMLGI